MTEQTFSVEIEISGISLIGASPRSKPFATRRKPFTRCVTRLDQDFAEEAGTAERWFYLGKPVKTVGNDFRAMQPSSGCQHCTRGARLDDGASLGARVIACSQRNTYSKGPLADHRTQCA